MAARSRSSVSTSSSRRTLFRTRLGGRHARSRCGRCSGSCRRRSCRCSWPWRSDSVARQRRIERRQYRCGAAEWMRVRSVGSGGGSGDTDGDAHIFKRRRELRAIAGKLFEFEAMSRHTLAVAHRDTLSRSGMRQPGVRPSVGTAPVFTHGAVRESSEQSARRIRKDARGEHTRSAVDRGWDGLARSGYEGVG